MRILVHVGNPKTGSSSLQQYLHSHRAELAAVGVLYPDFGHRAHWLLSGAFTKFGRGSRFAKRLASSKKEIELEEFRTNCRGIIQDFAGELLIFSNEGLSSEPRATNFLSFVKEARPEADIVVLDYIRDPTQHFPSSAQQNLKAEGDRSLYPAHWLSNHCVRGTYLLRSVEDELVFRVFSSSLLVNGDVIDDFRYFVKQRFEIDLPENTDKAPRNASHSGAACAVLALRDLAPHAPLGQKDRKKLGKPLRATDDALKPPKLKLPEQYRKAILANNAVDWNTLVDASNYEEDTRSSLKLPSARMPANMEKQHSGLWVIKSLTPRFVQELLSQITKSSPGAAGKRLSEWLICAVNETTSLHGVSVGEQNKAVMEKLEKRQKKRERKEDAAAAEGDSLAIARVAARSDRSAEEKAIRKAARQRERGGAAIENDGLIKKQAQPFLPKASSANSSCSDVQLVTGLNGGIVALRSTAIIGVATAADAKGASVSLEGGHWMKVRGTGEGLQKRLFGLSPTDLKSATR